jgi:hypothetical protein
MKSGENVACLRGFEPPTFGSGARSIPPLKEAAAFDGRVGAKPVSPAAGLESQRVLGQGDERVEITLVTQGRQFRLDSKRQPPTQGGEVF